MGFCRPLVTWRQWSLLRHGRNVVTMVVSCLLHALTKVQRAGLGVVWPKGPVAAAVQRQGWHLEADLG